MIPYMKRNLLMIAWLMAGSVWGQEADGYYGILNANQALIDSVSNESGTLTGDFSTHPLLGLVELPMARLQLAQGAWACADTDKRGKNRIKNSDKLLQTNKNHLSRGLILNLTLNNFALPSVYVPKEEKLAYYILVAADVDRALLALPSAYDVAMYRLKNRFWGFKETTRNRNCIKPNDKVLIYTAGKRRHGRCFIASAEVSSSIRPTNISARNVDSPVAQRAISCALMFDLKNVKKFRTLVSIYEVKDKLKCIKNPKSIKWACVLQNGSLRIAREDYLSIYKRG
jgi:hypothetical protein